MILGGFLPLTLLDYPGQTACIAFTQGCNLRCTYCHNPQLIPFPTPTKASSPPESWIMHFLNARRRCLDGLVLSGGEPTLQPDLLPFLQRIKELGFLIKLDTNGTHPLVLQEALRRGLLDYVAMDIKHDPLRYDQVTQVPVDSRVLAASRDLILASNIAYEFRTTLLPGIHSETTIERIACFCRGARRFVLQSFRKPLQNQLPDYETFSSSPSFRFRFHRFQQILAQFVDEVILPGEEQRETSLP